MRGETRLSLKIDWYLVGLYLLIVFLGYLNLYSSDYKPLDNLPFFKTEHGRQFIWIIISLVLAFGVMFIENVAFPMLSYIVYIVVLSLLVLVFLFGIVTNGARSWLIIGGFQIQPSEFAKFATALALARFISLNGFELNLRNLTNNAIIAAFIMIPVAVILLQPDVGTALSFFAFILVLYREGLPAKYLWFILISILVFVLALLINNLLLLGIILIVGLIFLLYAFDEKKDFRRVLIDLVSIFSVTYFLKVLFKIKLELYEVSLIALFLWGIYNFVYFGLKRKSKVLLVLFFMFTGLVVQFLTDIAFHEVLKPHHRNRIEVLFDNSIDPQGIGYNLRQSKIAIGSGGFVGKGFLHGTQTKLNFVPAHNTDFIFCTVAEEWGFVGVVVLFVLYGALFIRIIRKAEQQISTFSRVYGYSVAMILFLHFFVNIGMTMGLLPVIGIPLPFFSYGGSAMLGFSILLFIFIKLDTEKDLNL